MYRPLRYLLAGAAGLAVLWIGVGVAASRAGPYLKGRIIRDLSERFGGSVELGALRVSGFPELRVAGENLVMRGNGNPDAHLLTVRNFEFRTNPLAVLRWPLSAGTIQVTGLSITVPPRGKRAKLEGTGTPPKAASKWGLTIGRVVCDDVRLEISTEKPGKEPLVFAIHSVVLDSAGPGRAMPFTGKLTNPKPIGDIDTKGEFGPWQTEEPRDTPLSGTYSFTKADLATIRGIGGILSSKGSYHGVLDKIEVQGATDTADFTVATGHHPMALHTDYQATVDGTDGNTYLHPVRATLGRSVITANGSVVRESGGRRISLELASDTAYIEDLLKAAVKTNPPELSGPVMLKSQFFLAPGEASVPDRLQLDGEFNLAKARFPNTATQEKLSKLSARAEGRPREIAQHDTPDVFSELRGKFKMKDGVVSISELNLKIPGASLALAGDYRLDDQEFSFEGQARLEAKLSQTTTGAKSFLLKLLDPIFSRNGAGTFLPIRISGSGTKPSVALDLGHPSRATQ